MHGQLHAPHCEAKTKTKTILLCHLSRSTKKGRKTQVYRNISHPFTFLEPHVKQSHKTQVYRNISRPFTVLQPQVKQSLNILQSLVICWHCYSTWSLRQYMYTYLCNFFFYIVFFFVHRSIDPLSARNSVCVYVIVRVTVEHSGLPSGVEDGHNRSILYYCYTENNDLGLVTTV